EGHRICLPFAQATHSDLPTINIFDTFRIPMVGTLASQAMPRHKVLIVEDEHDIAGLIKHTLERGGDADAEIVSSGDAALAAVTEQPPHLILPDLNLPVTSGIDVCRILRSRADGPPVPIILLTARTSAADRVAIPDPGPR